MGAGKLASIVILAAVLATSCGTAMAEGARNSSMYDVYTGFNFQKVHDNDSDAPLSCVYLDGCITGTTGWPYTIRIRLWRVYSLAPDVDQGSRTFTYQGATKTWSDKPAGEYHFTVDEYNGQSDTSLSCANVNYGW